MLTEDKDTIPFAATPTLMLSFLCTPLLCLDKTGLHQCLSGHHLEPFCGQHFFLTVKRVGRSKTEENYSELIHTESQSGKCLFFQWRHANNFQLTRQNTRNRMLPVIFMAPVFKKTFTVKHDKYVRAVAEMLRVTFKSVLIVDCETQNFSEFS